MDPVLGRGGAARAAMRTGPPIISIMQARSITRAVALVDIAMIGPAVIAGERDWGSIITPLEIVLLSAIVATGFVAVEWLRQIALSQGTQ